MILKAMVADNERGVLSQLSEWDKWRPLGFALCGVASSVPAAEKLTETVRPDVIVMDVGMDGGRGMELIRYVRERYPKIPVIATVTEGNFDLACDAVRYNISRMIVKSHLEEQLAEALSDVRDMARAERVQSFRLIRENEKTPVGDGAALIHEVVDYLEANYTEKLSLGIVSKEFYLCSWHLCKQFKRYTGKTFIDMLNQIRIRHAQELLMGTLLKVYEVAYKVGFSDLAYFTAVFKRYNDGISPRQFRVRGARPVLWADEDWV